MRCDLLTSACRLDLIDDLNFELETPGNGWSEIPGTCFRRALLHHFRDEAHFSGQEFQDGQVAR